MLNITVRDRDHARELYHLGYSLNPTRLHLQSSDLEKKYSNTFIFKDKNTRFSDIVIDTGDLENILDRLAVRCLENWGELEVFIKDSNMCQAMKVEIDSNNLRIMEQDVRHMQQQIIRMTKELIESHKLNDNLMDQIRSLTTRRLEE